VRGIVELRSRAVRERDEDLVPTIASLGDQIGQFVERLQAEEDVRAGEARRSAILESALDCVIAMDHRGLITEFNPAAERTFGYAREEVIGRELAAVVVPPALRERHRRGLARYLASGESDILGARLEPPAMRADGSEFPAELTVTRVELPGPALFTGYIRDPTERRRAEEALREAQRMDAVGRLAGGIAHDFNNLLSVIGGFADLALRRPEASGELREYLQQIARASDQGAALTRQLLDFSRRQPLERTVLRVNRVVAELDAMLRRVLGEHLRLVTVFGAARGLVEINRGQLEQVIVNLAVNARDAMPGGGKLTIETDETDLHTEDARRRGLDPGAYVVLRITDTGRGMDGETQARIFEPFFTTKARGQGTGLGLATVYGIVTGTGGHLEVDSAPGRGTAFTIRLPAARADHDAQQEPPDAPAVAAPRATVLVAEDDPPRARGRRLHGPRRRLGRTRAGARRGTPRPDRRAHQRRRDARDARPATRRQAHGGTPRTARAARLGLHRGAARRTARRRLPGQAVKPDALLDAVAGLIEGAEAARAPASRPPR